VQNEHSSRSLTLCTVSGNKSYCSVTKFAFLHVIYCEISLLKHFQCVRNSSISLSNCLYTFNFPTFLLLVENLTKNFLIFPQHFVGSSLNKSLNAIKIRTFRIKYSSELCMRYQQDSAVWYNLYSAVWYNLYSAVWYNLYLKHYIFYSQSISLPRTRHSTYSCAKPYSAFYILLTCIM
jgi:hypothetical protein